MNYVLVNFKEKKPHFWTANNSTKFFENELVKYLAISNFLNMHFPF